MRSLLVERLGVREKFMAFDRLHERFARSPAEGAEPGMNGVDWPWLEWRLRSQPIQSPLWQDVIEIVTIGETYFFREPIHFQIIRELMRAHRNRSCRRPSRFVVWCAGCSTGEEAYTVAAVAEDVFGSQAQEIVRIIGSDVSSRRLETASRGEYGQNSLRFLSQEVIERVLVKRGSSFAVRPHYRSWVTFSTINVLEDLSTRLAALGVGALDIVICRNLVHYFGEEPRRRTIGALVRQLRSEGSLLLSPVLAGFDPREWALSAPDPLNSPTHLVKASRKPAATASSREPPAPRPEGRTEDGSLERGQELVVNGNAALALEWLRKAVRENEESIETRVWLGRALASLNRVEEARLILEVSLTEAPQLPAPYRVLALLALSAGDHEEAARLLRRVLYIDPDDVLANFLAFIVYEALGHTRLRQSYLAHLQNLLKREVPSCSTAGPRSGPERIQEWERLEGYSMDRITHVVGGAS